MVGQGYKNHSESYCLHFPAGEKKLLEKLVSKHCQLPCDENKNGEIKQR